MGNSKGAIGVFDSGMGGVSVLGELMRQMPHENFIYYGDSANAPYGVKTTDELVRLSRHICDFLIERGCKAIVIACNTATSAAVVQLRKEYDIPIIGMEPALKPAVEDAPAGEIAVMATEVTLREDKFVDLMGRIGADRVIHKVPCPELVPLVESGAIDGSLVNDAISHCFQGRETGRISGVVLGCTHFVYLKQAVRQVLGDHVTIYDGNLGTAKHLYNLLAEKNLLNDQEEESHIQIINSLNQQMVERSNWLLDQYKYV